jgi:hypothetical protein
MPVTLLYGGVLKGVEVFLVKDLGNTYALIRSGQRLVRSIGGGYFHFFQAKFRDIILIISNARTRGGLNENEKPVFISIHIFPICDRRI